jgi:hypothetical protein
MTSVFAALHRLGVPPIAAMACQLLVAAVAVLALALKARSDMPRELVLALAVGVSLTISPYTYDYDMVSLALVAGLVLPRFLERATRLEVLLALLLTWIATANYLWVGLRQLAYGVPAVTADMRLWTISPLALGGLSVLLVTVLCRQPRVECELPCSTQPVQQPMQG